jgi:hypothetical protein
LRVLIACAVRLLAFASATPVALAGGVPVQLAAAAGEIWTCSDAGLVVLDVRTGRILRHPTVGSSYPLQVALARGVAWIAGVENGFVAGALSRVDLATGRSSVVLRSRRAPVFAVAASGGRVWALVGPTSHARVVQIDAHSGRRIGLVHGVSEPAAVAADRSGIWIVDATGWLLHARPSDRRASRVLRVPPGSRAALVVALGLGSAWVSDSNTLVRVDERTNRPLARIGMRGLPLAVAAGDGAVWALLLERSKQHDRMWLARVGTMTNTVDANIRVSTSASSVGVGAGGVWVGVSGFSPRVLRVNVRTLAVRLLARLG